MLEATAAEWAADTTVYSANHLLFDTTNGVMKKGNGTNAYADLDTFGEVAAWADVANKPTVIAAGTTAATAWAEIQTGAIGTTATKAAAGNHDHAITADVASGLAQAANLQALAVALSARIKVLEDAV